MSNIYEKIHNKSAKVAVIGLGYVGLPLAAEIANAGFTTFGIDLSQDKVDAINDGNNYIKDVNSNLLCQLVKAGKLSASSNYECLQECDFISICVPTPLGKGKVPDISFIISATNEIKEYLRRGQTIILESTTYPGTTEEVVLPILEESGLKVGEDFHLAFSPERIDPGNEKFTVKNTPKVIGGITLNCAESAQSLYQTFIERVILVSSAKSAEMVKILENTFRAINIGLANEIAIMCNHMGIDTWEVIDAAASKPFGFMPFYPGPGLGGHCIPVDPHYLVWKMKLMDYNPRFIQLADEINSAMPHYVVRKIVSALNTHKKALNGSSILMLGVAYKSDINDVRESPAVDVISQLQGMGASVDYHDPFVPECNIDGTVLASKSLDGIVEKYDCVVVLTNHSSFKIREIVDKANLIIDTRNATREITGESSKIVKL